MFNFLHKKASKVPSEIDKIFSFLSSETHHPDIIENYLSQYQKLKNKYKGSDDIFIKLYLNWEEFIVNNKTENYRNHTIESLRQFISAEININTLSFQFRLLFLKRREQIISVYETFVLNIVDYMNTQLGYATLVKTMQDLKDPLLAKIRISTNSLDFDLLNKAVADVNIYSLDEITKSFKNLIGALYGKIELSLGEKLTKNVFENMFNEFKNKYNADLSATILKIIPERIIGMNEWLSMMSKKELERQVVEKTEELQKINESLEQTVNQRTQELKVAYEDLKALDEKKSEFISVAAHQLRTPLSAIKWSLGMFKNGELGSLTDEQKTFLEKTISSNNKVIELVNNLLDIDLYTKDKQEYAFVVSDISQVIQNVIESVSQLCKKRNIKIEYDVPTEKINAEIDTAKIEIVVDNLITNAIKYGDVGSSIKITVQKINTIVRISVTNQGIGIPKEAQKDMFQRFFRAQNAIRRETEGMGIGLFISKNIVEDHCGRIWFESKKEGETTFYVEIPISKKNNLNCDII